MNDGSVLLLFLLVALVLLWFFVWGPHAKEARAERKHREAEERARREAERSKLEAECEALLESIRPGVPDVILIAHLEFEREYRSKGGQGHVRPRDVAAGMRFADILRFHHVHSLPRGGDITPDGTHGGSMPRPPLV